ncbi:MAG: hypothetical protein SangKO_068630 [Sandaracinaceae bacterium]
MVAHRPGGLAAAHRSRRGETPPGLAEARRDLIALLERLHARGRIEPSQTVLAGFSQGAMLATAASLEWSERPAALVIMSGGDR